MYHMLKMINPFTSRLHLHYPDEFSLFQLDFTWQKSWLVVRLKKAKINHDFKLFKSSSLALNVSSNLPQSTAYLLLSLCIPFWRLLHRNPFSVKMTLMIQLACDEFLLSQKANLKGKCYMHLLLSLYFAFLWSSAFIGWTERLVPYLTVHTIVDHVTDLHGKQICEPFAHSILLSGSSSSLYGFPSLVDDNIVVLSRGKESSHSHDSARA